MRAAAAATLAIAVVLLLGTWDGLYGALDLPQALPALTAQLGGAAMLALAYLLWAGSGATPESMRLASFTGAIACGAGALVIALWLIVRDPGDDLHVGTLGTVILIATAVVLAGLAAGLAMALRPRTP
jgi:hypothetical protein